MSLPSAHTAFNPARELAVRVLIRVLAGETFASPELDAALSRAKLSPRDAGLATHIVYGVLRYHPSLSQQLSLLLRGKTHPKAMALLLAGTFEKTYLQTPIHAVVNEYVHLARFARLAPPGLVNAVLRKVDATPAPAAANFPAWLVKAFPWDEEVLLDLLQPQPLWLYASERGKELLQQEGHQLHEQVLGVIKTTLMMPLAQTLAYREGEIQPVNPASVACIELLGPVHGKKVLDLAGGAGVKAALLACRGADVLSVDLIPYKHTLAQKNFKRLRQHGTFLTHDLTQPLLHRSDLVLLDAPCTGTGTLRGNPEIKLRLTQQAVEEMAALQLQMLYTAAECVLEGGILVYSVCSVLPQEGEQVIEQFLKEHPNWRVEYHSLEIDTQPAGAGFLTIPQRGIDGFFMVRLRRGA